MGTTVGIDEIRQAAERIGPYILHTPFLQSGWLSKITGSRVLVKWESQQITGSFKLRGALNKMLRLKERGIDRVLAVSAGNHGQGLAYAAKILGMQATVVVSTSAARTKVNAIRSYGADLIERGESYDEAEQIARSLADEMKIEFVSPYNDSEVLAGQGTVALEMLEEERLDLLLVPVGGGGLLAGAAIAARSIGKETKVLGVQPANSTAMYSSFRSGRLVTVTETPTCADGLAGNIEAESITFPIIKETVSDIVLVSEEQIARAILGHLEHDHMVVEGAGAVPTGALLEGKILLKDSNIGLIISGRNIDSTRLAALLCKRS
jgi:threonine dehydratase